MRIKRENFEGYCTGCGTPLRRVSALNQTVPCPQCQDRQAKHGIDRVLKQVLNVIPDSNRAREQLKVRIRELFLDEDGRLTLGRLNF